MTATQKTEIANEIRSDIRAVMVTYVAEKTTRRGIQSRRATRDYIASCILDLRALRAY